MAASSRRPKPTVADELKRLQTEVLKAPAIAKRELVKFRDSLSAAQRATILNKLGLRRATDIRSREALKPIFDEEVYRWICEVGDDSWVYKEPTFSWLAGFYWHPDARNLQLGGRPHDPFFCHLCEVECWDTQNLEVHEATRRHSECLARWVERMGATEPPSTCRRCRRSDSHATAGVGEDVEMTSAQSPGDDDDAQGAEECVRQGCAEADFIWRRPNGQAEVEVPPESAPPWGFDAVVDGGESWDGLKRPGDVTYVSFAVHIPTTGGDGYDRWSGWGRKRNSYAEEESAVEKVRITSKTVKIGPRVSKSEWMWRTDLQESLEKSEGESVWRSLAVPLTQAKKTWDKHHDFAIVLEYSGGEERTFWVRLPLRAAFPGHVTCINAWVSTTSDYKGARRGAWEGRDKDKWSSSQSQWAERSQWAETTIDEAVSLREFVGIGQIESLGGVERLRGRQRAIQFATEDVMVSFLLYLPERQAPAPLLLFLHGDLDRDSSQCTMPGLASFVGEYGAAELVSLDFTSGRPAASAKGKKAASDVAKEFVVVTPSCPPEFWWLRYPAKHDSTSYAASMESWFVQLLNLLEVQLTVSLRSEPDAPAPRAGIRLAGQSMGGYAALELARAMPERVAAIAAGAPCFDSFRLDWLVRRIVNIPLLMFIGRQDDLCAFEEVASLALKLRDAGAKQVNFTTRGVKDHNQACKFLDKRWVYEWLKEPLA